MDKKPIRLTESDLHTIVEDVVSSMMNENWGSNFWGKLGYNQNDLKPQMQQQQGQQQRQQYQSQGQQQQTQPQQQQLQQYKQQIRQYLTSADNYVNMALGAIEDGDYNYVTQALNKIKEILTPIYMGRI
jgi:uncharacterized protein YaaR (DUF327 family)